VSSQPLRLLVSRRSIPQYSPLASHQRSHRLFLVLNQAHNPRESRLRSQALSRHCSQRCCQLGNLLCSPQASLVPNHRHSQLTGYITW
jgi:hypothetical protein